MADPIEPTVRHLVAQGLVAADLSGPCFDTEMIAADLTDRMVVDAGLDEFVGRGDPGEPQPFDPLAPQ